MSRFLTEKFKGIYRVLAEINSNNEFPRELNDSYSTNDLYIPCQNKCKIFHYGKNILYYYCPSIGRGNNKLKDVERIGNNLIFDIEKTDSEVLFKFKYSDFDKLVDVLKPTTLASNRSPFSTKNLAKSKYKIPEEDLVRYKNLISNLGSHDMLTIRNMTVSFLKGISKSDKKYKELCKKQRNSVMDSKQFIHSNGKWEDYLKYLQKEMG